MCDDKVSAGGRLSITTKLTTGDVKGLADLAATAGKRFRTGVVLYQGSTVVPFGDRLWAVPLSATFAAERSG